MICFNSFSALSRDGKFFKHDQSSLLSSSAPLFVFDQLHPLFGCSALRLRPVFICSSSVPLLVFDQSSSAFYDWIIDKMWATSSIKAFSFKELNMATGNFSPDAWLAKGELSNIYKGWLDEKTLSPSKIGDGMLVVIKYFNIQSEKRFEQWQSEVNILGRHYHPNLIGLLGYCWEDEKLLLVYEFMPKGGLDVHLFRRECAIKPPLSWDIRVKIAIGAAQGLTFLHALEKKVIYRYFKTQNILLDENYNAKLSNFILARLGPSSEGASVSTFVVGTTGYIAPEYFLTGNLYLKSDVYGFGVVLLELLMGLSLADPEHPCAEQNLVDWLKPILSQETKLETIMDARLEGQYSYEAALQAAQLCLRCLQPDPRNRPSMKGVVEVLKEIETLEDKTTCVE